MSALDIVLVSVLSVIIFTILLMIIIKKYSKRFFRNQRNDFLIMDRNIKQGTNILLGDSLTDFFQINEYLDECVIKNRGIAEDTTNDIMERIEEIKSIKSNCVYLQIGINDLIQKGKKLKSYELANRIIKIADILHENGSDVYIISLYPINRKKMLFSKYVCGKANNDLINRTNKELKELCDTKHYIYINIHDSLCDAYGNLKEEYTLEGLHLTALAYEEITKVLKQFF